MSDKLLILEKESTNFLFEPEEHEMVKLEDVVTDATYFNDKLVDGNIKSGKYLLDAAYYHIGNFVIDQGSILKVENDNYHLYYEDISCYTCLTKERAIEFINHWANLI